MSWAKEAGAIEPYTWSYPDNMKAKVTIKLYNGNTFEAVRENYYGFFTAPFTWETVIEKFQRLSAPNIGAGQQSQVIHMVRNLEQSPDRGSLISLITGTL